MTVHIVTRHAGSIEWLARKGVRGNIVLHLERGTLDGLEPGDLVVGTLPVPLIASVCATGARYVHLRLDLPRDRRGDDLTADEVEAFGARLEAFHAIVTPMPDLWGDGP